MMGRYTGECRAVLLATFYAVGFVSLFNLIYRPLETFQGALAETVVLLKYKKQHKVVSH